MCRHLDPCIDIIYHEGLWKRAIENGGCWRLKDLLVFCTLQVIEEREKLKSDREARQKKMYYLRTELERLHKQQGIRHSFA